MDAWGDAPNRPATLDEVVVKPNHFTVGPGKRLVDEVMALRHGVMVTDDDVTTVGAEASMGLPATSMGLPAMPSSTPSVAVRLIAPPSSGTAHATEVQPAVAVSGEEGRACASQGTRCITTLQHEACAALGPGEEQQQALRGSARTVRQRMRSPPRHNAAEQAHYDAAVRMVPPPMSELPIHPLAMHPGMHAPPVLRGPPPPEGQYSSIDTQHYEPRYPEPYMFADGPFAAADAAAFGKAPPYFGAGPPPDAYDAMAAEGAHGWGWHMYDYGGYGPPPHAAPAPLIPRPSVASGGWESPRLSILSLPSHGLSVPDPAGLEDLLQQRPCGPAIMPRASFGAPEGFPHEGDAWASVQLCMGGPGGGAGPGACAPAWVPTSAAAAATAAGSEEQTACQSGSAGLPPGLATPPPARPPLAAHTSVAASTEKHVSDGQQTASTTAVLPEQAAQDQALHDSVMDFIKSPEFGAACQSLLSKRPSAGGQPAPAAQHGQQQEAPPALTQRGTDGAAMDGAACGPLERIVSLRFGVGETWTGMGAQLTAAGSAAAAAGLPVPPPAAAPGGDAGQQGRPGGCPAPQGPMSTTAAHPSRGPTPPPEQNAHLNLPPLRGLSAVRPAGVPQEPQAYNGRYGVPPAVAARNPFAHMGLRALPHHGRVPPGHMPPYMHGYTHPSLAHEYAHSAAGHPYQTMPDLCGPFAGMPRRSDAHSSMGFGDGGMPAGPEHGLQPGTARSHAMGAEEAAVPGAARDAAPQMPPQPPPAAAAEQPHGAPLYHDHPMPLYHEQLRYHAARRQAGAAARGPYPLHLSHPAAHPMMEDGYGSSLAGAAAQYAAAAQHHNRMQMHGGGHMRPYLVPHHMASGGGGYPGMPDSYMAALQARWGSGGGSTQGQPQDQSRPAAPAAVNAPPHAPSTAPHMVVPGPEDQI